MNRFHRAYQAGADNMRNRAGQRDCCAGGCSGNSHAGMQEISRCAKPDAPMLLALGTVPSQCFENLLSPVEGWRCATMFADLYKPYEGGCCQ